MTVLRMKKWKTYFDDGRSSIEYTTIHKHQVAVAIILGYEPDKIFDPRQKLNVEAVLLGLAERIKQDREEEQKELKKKRRKKGNK